MSVSRETLDADVSRETLERLRTFVELLTKWNSKINLVSRRDIGDVWTRHVRDSLQLAALLPDHARAAADLGSGGGFPGMVLAIATGLTFRLVEADARKAAFLREVARMTHTTVDVMNQRIEHVRVPPLDVITARALAPLPKLLDLAYPLLRPNGTLLLLKGATAEREIAEACRQWTMRIEQHISQTGAGGVILRISEVERA